MPRGCAAPVVSSSAAGGAVAAPSFSAVGHPDSRASLLGLVLVCLAAALWATVGVASRLMTPAAALDPVAAGLARTALGAAAVLLVAELARAPGPRLLELPLGPLAAFAGAGAVFQTTLFAAFAEVGVTITVAVTVCAPPVIVAAGEALTRRRAPCMAVSAAIGLAAGNCSRDWFQAV